MKTSAPAMEALRISTMARGAERTVMVDVPLSERDERGSCRTKREINTK